jgi:RNA polymerase sigma-70 factor (ECF subfamily)
VGLGTTIQSLASATWPGGLPDEVLVAAAIDGDEEAFGTLASRHRQMALRTAAFVVGRSGAEDIVQDALLLAFRALKSIGDPSKFSRWLSTITRYRALRVSRNEARKRAGTVRLDENVLATVSSVAFDPRRDEEGDEELLEALERIPPQYAEVMRLHFLHGLPHRKIADFVGAPVATIRWRCFRGKELLRSVLAAGGSGATRFDRACHRCFDERRAEGCAGACPGEPKLKRTRIRTEPPEWSSPVGRIRLPGR